MVDDLCSDRNVVFASAKDKCQSDSRPFTECGACMKSVIVKAGESRVSVPLGLFPGGAGVTEVQSLLAAFGGSR